MLTILSDYSLAEQNTLAVPAVAEFFCALQYQQLIPEAFAWAEARGLGVTLLGSGSNVILAPQLKGLVIQLKHLGIDVIEETASNIKLKVKAGENWHSLVKQCVEREYFGLENLALIPGSVGAAPIQNIGAYGVEVAELISEVHIYDRLEKSFRVLTQQECQFGYRDSIFKQRENFAIVTEVVFNLPKTFTPNLRYPALNTSFKSEAEISAQAVFDKVIEIRSSKLPNPEKLPNCGSFFKNPIVSQAKYQQLVMHYPDMPSYPQGDDQQIKIPAAWLIDNAGLKGQSFDGVIVHQHQALVLTNPNRLAADAILNAAEKIRSIILAKYDIKLELEPISLA